MEPSSSKPSEKLARHKWIEERVFSHETLRHERRRRCLRCGTGEITEAMNPQPCPGRRVSPWE